MRWLVLALAASVAACAAPPAPRPKPAAPTPSPAPSGVDGRYRGTARLLRAANANCPRSGPRVLELSGGVLTLAYSVPPRRRVSLSAPIAADGSIHASDGEGVLDGRFTGSGLEVTISSGMCEHRWTLTKIN